jgi:hypothetical protein
VKIRWMSLCVSLTLLACSGPEGLEDDPQADTQKGRFGLVSVGYDHDWSDSGETLLLTSTAQFVRYSAMDRDQVARLLALPLDPEHDLPAQEHCKVYDLSVEPLEEAADTEAYLDRPKNVELLEAGDLLIQDENGKTLTLAPKHFPWLLPFISGVVYGEAQASLGKRVFKVKASSTGGEAVGTFSAQIGCPALPRLQEIASQKPASVVVVSRAQDLTLNWQTTTEKQTGDVTYLELRYSKGKRDLALRCRPADDGSFSVPRALLADLGNGRLTLELARLQQTGFSATGLDLGELRVTVRDRAQLEFGE